MAYVQQRGQAQALIDAAAAEPDGRMPEHGVTSNHHDSARLRGIPAIGPNVAGVCPNTHPEQEAIRRISAANRWRDL